MTTTPATSGGGLRQTLRTNWFYLLFLIFLIALPFLLGALTGTSPTARRGAAIFWQGVAIELMIISILAMSYNLMFGFTGVISFGHALFFGLSGYIMGAFQRAPEFGGAGLVIGIVAALIACAVLGTVIGLVTLRLKGVYFAIFTLAVAEMAFIFLGRFGPTGSEDGFTLLPLPEWFDPSRNRLVFYYITAALFVFTFLFIRRLVVSPAGAVLLAIRENENRARTVGFNTLAYKLLAITVAGMLAGVAGMLLTLFNKKVGPEMLSSAFTVDPLLMTIIGGIGTFAGPVIGAVGLDLTEHLMRDATLTIGSTSIDIGASWPLILGLIFIFVVILFPRGFSQLWLVTFPKLSARLRGKKA